MTQSIDDKIRITRVFDAPRSMVFQAFTVPDRLAQWFGPVGNSTPSEEMVIEPHAGGRERIVMIKDGNPDEREELESVYTEVVDNELVAGHSVGEGHGAGNFRLEITVWPFTGKEVAELLEGWESGLSKLEALFTTSTPA